MKQILPGISRLWECKVDSLPEDVEMACINFNMKPMITDIEEIPLIGEGELTIERDRAGSMGYETASLTYRSNEPAPRVQRLCYCVRDVNGVDRLIGSKEKGVRVSSVWRAGSPGGDPAGWEHTVTYSALSAAPECLITV
ncbi:MAG: hypothetical protein NC217_07755 [Muribaculaceae bacterium]|nr:hypothetical protein [Muribaculaceae bacterium]